MATSTHRLQFATLAALSLFVVGGCRDVESNRQDSEPGHGASAPTPGADTATVLETLEADPYTYVQIEVDGEPTWFAGPKVAIAVGDTIEVPSQEMLMRDFPSKTLGRTFEEIYFVGELVPVGKSGGAAAAAGAKPAEVTDATSATESSAAPAAMELPDGGVTVAGLFELGKAASGQQVVFRGRVVKSNANILGKNWLHVQDGTGAAGTNDITVTTADTADVGDTVLVRGTLVADKDFGAGYAYDLMVEEASVTVE